MHLLDELVKTYDVRGLVANQLTEAVAEALGFGFAEELELAGLEFVIGYDMRESSPRLAAAFARGAATAGARALSLGLCSTDMTYFVSGARGLPAVMFTASHNPAIYNGIKFSRAGAQGISLDTGLAAIRDRAKRFLSGHTRGLSPEVPKPPNPAPWQSIDVKHDYVSKLRSMVTLGNRRLKVVIDAANGMAGFTVPLVLGDAAGLAALNLEIVELFFELDGSFPNHEANPLNETNLADLKRAVLSSGADLGLAFDGDADRCFVVDERGAAVSPSAVSAIVARVEIRRAQALAEPRPKVIHNLLTSRFVAEAITAHGGEPLRTRVGHSLIKQQMAATGAVFGAEHSAHYYFRDFWGADNGMLAALYILAELSSTEEKMSDLGAASDPYCQSGEINLTVTDTAAATERLHREFSDAEADWLDGLTLSGELDGSWWWLNLRPSNTEPLLRLNVESNLRVTMESVRDQALGLLSGR